MASEKEKIPVALLGATGNVGKAFIDLLRDHPLFRLQEAAASERSAGKPLEQLTLKSCSDLFSSPLIFSALDPSCAGEVEKRLSDLGHLVITNARNHRMEPGVPLLIPEVNPEHLELVNGEGGHIIANPNCSTIGLVLALKPLADRFGIEAVHVVTMQALSGAGSAGLKLDLVDNVIPYISGEEEKIETEPLKILGDASLKISASSNRVAVTDGHLMSVSIKLKKQSSKDQLIDAWESFRGVPQQLGLPSAPAQPIHYLRDYDVPQPKKHRLIENGMGVAVGRLRPCPLFDFKFTLLSHNMVRGAAGGAILCAELACSRKPLFRASILPERCS